MKKNCFDHISLSRVRTSSPLLDTVQAREDNCSSRQCHEVYLIGRERGLNFHYKVPTMMLIAMMNAGWTMVCYRRLRTNASGAFCINDPLS